MKRKSFIFLILIAIGSFCFAQGRYTPCELIYPDDFCKDSFILQKKTINISKGIKKHFKSEVILDVENVKESTVSTFVYTNLWDPASLELEEDCISVYINDKSVKTVKDIYQPGEKYLFEMQVPSGDFKIKYIIEHNGQEISGKYQCRISNYFIENWNVSDCYSEEMFISLYNDVISFFSNDEPTDVKLVGNGKQNGNEYFLKSGYFYYSTKKINSEFNIICKNFYNGCGGDGSGIPVLPSTHNADHKIHSSTQYIYEFISAAKMIECKLRYYNQEFYNDIFEDLINLLNDNLNKDELRILRNAFYAKNGYVFKDENLNKYFSSALCYWPDKSVAINNIKMNESEKILIEMIQAAERGESPEAVFDKYKQ
jgi:hypothetical protein